jgi:hypothetical protein
MAPAVTGESQAPRGLNAWALRCSSGRGARVRLRSGTERGVAPVTVTSWTCSRGSMREANPGAPMTPLPAGSIWDEIGVVGQAGDGLRVRCPIWTETGRSGLAIEIIVERDEFGSLYIGALVDDRGDTVMSTPMHRPPTTRLALTPPVVSPSPRAEIRPFAGKRSSAPARAC